MAVERRQLPRDRKDDRQRRAATEAVSFRDASHGRGPPQPGPGVGSSGVRVEFEPPRSGRVESARVELKPEPTLTCSWSRRGSWSRRRPRSLAWVGGRL